MKTPFGATVFVFLLASAAGWMVVATKTGMIVRAQSGVTLAALQGNWVGKSIGFTTLCVNAGGCSAASPALEVFNFAAVAQLSVDNAGNFCATATNSNAPVRGSATGANISNRILTGSITSFDPGTQQAQISFQIYNGGSCTGPTFNNYQATLTTNGTGYAAVSGSGQQIDGVATSYVSVDGTVGSVVNTVTYHRQ
jgi:hypothetical protein